MSRGAARVAEQGTPQRSPSRSRSQRPLLAALLVLAALVVAMTVGPAQRYTAAATRVDELRAQRAALTQEVDRLQERRTRLEDPEEVELLARSELGLVRPGEIPYVVVPPTPPAESPPPTTAPAPWWERAVATVRDTARRLAP